MYIVSNESYNFEHREAGLNAFSVWSIVVLNFSHFLLVINSTVNLFVYCTRGSRFRREFFNFATSIAEKTGRRFS